MQVIQVPHKVRNIDSALIERSRWDLNPSLPYDLSTKPMCYQMSYPGLDLHYIFFSVYGESWRGWRREKTYRQLHRQQRQRQQQQQQADDSIPILTWANKAFQWQLQSSLCFWQIVNLSRFVSDCDEKKSNFLKLNQNPSRVLQHI